MSGSRNSQRVQEARAQIDGHIVRGINRAGLNLPSRKRAPQGPTLSRAIIDWVAAAMKRSARWGVKRWKAWRD